MAGGRPRRISTPDKAVEDAVRRAVEELALAAHRQRGRNRRPEPLGHLLFAVTAARFAAAADRIAHAHVQLARETEGATWEQVGEAFGTTRQSAHERFHADRSLA